jgi:uncharacterized protein with HEPN domain
MKDLHTESHKRLQHILEAIQVIEGYVRDADASRFVSDSMLHDAVLFQFMVIGEAIMHIENDILDRYVYPWYKVRSFRNLIAHEYFNIKLTAVWGIIDSDLPLLKQTIVNILGIEFET